MLLLLQLFAADLLIIDLDKNLFYPLTPVNLKALLHMNDHMLFVLYPMVNGYFQVLLILLINDTVEIHIQYADFETSSILYL